MSSHEIQEFFQAIQDNNLSKFGIIKLSSLVLEKTFVVINDAVVEVENGAGDGERTSLMRFAVSKGRDKIIAALIRGGYDPSVHPSMINSKKSVNSTSSLTTFPPGYSVWLVKFVYQMIDDAATNQTQNSTCELCTRNCFENTFTEENNLFLKWNLCGHETCSRCTWETICKPLQDCNYSLRCPICKVRCDGGSDTVYLDDNTSVQRNDHQILIKELTSSERFHYSNQRWTQLPSENSCDHSEEESSNSPLVNKRPPFLVGPLFEVSKYLIGTTQEQRLVEFHRSIVDNNISRIYWIFLAGINVDGQNQYGQTGLMIAATLGHLESVNFLLWCGADPTIRDNIHSNASQAAARHGYHQICNLINENMGNLIESLPDRGLSPSLVNEAPVPSMTTLIPSSSLLSDGIGSCYLDNYFSESFLEYLDLCFNHCHTSFHSKPIPTCCPLRYHLYDSELIIRREISSALAYLQRHSEAQVSQCHSILPMMKYLHYTTLEAKLEPHIDLSKYDPITRISSTHTLILYLTTCVEGGETILMDHVTNPTIRIPVKPKRGRLLLFPHHCPHEGGVIRQVPKILLRCEAY
jgi:hypothetical protein